MPDTGWVNSAFEWLDPIPKTFAVDGWLEAETGAGTRTVKKILKASHSMKISRATVDNFWPSDCS